MSDRNCGSCHWRQWTVADGAPNRWECRNRKWVNFGYGVDETDGDKCPSWAEGKQVGTKFSELTQARFEEIGRTWGYD